MRSSSTTSRPCFWRSSSISPSSLSRASSILAVSASSCSGSGSGSASPSTRDVGHHPHSGMPLSAALESTSWDVPMVGLRDRGSLNLVHGVTVRSPPEGAEVYDVLVFFGSGSDSFGRKPGESLVYAIQLTHLQIGGLYRQGQEIYPDLPVHLIHQDKKETYLH